MARGAPAETEMLRELLVSLVRGTEAHMSFEDAVAGFPAEAMNRRAPNVGYTPWHILEHLRITQWDILEYIRDPQGHVSPDWPVGYWPGPDAETTPEGFRRTIEGFIADRAAVEAILRDPATDLFAVLAGTPGHTVFREAVVIGNHNSYHVGEFAVLRQVMGSWARRSRRG
jgi:DinB family protein